MSNNKNRNFWNIIVIILLIFLAIIFLNNFKGIIEKSDILNFYSNLLVVIITVTLGIITYEQTKHIQEESSKENEHLRKLNEEANETNKKLLKIIERNTELEEQKNMPCLSIKYSSGYKIYSENGEDIKIEFKNIGDTVIKHVDIDEIAEEVIIQNISNTLINGMKDALDNLTKLFENIFNEHTEKMDFLEFFNHDIDMIGIKEKFCINVKPKRIKSEDDEDLYVVALNMKIENIYRKSYNEKVIILLQRDTKEKRNVAYTIEGKYIDIAMND